MFTIYNLQCCQDQKIKCGKTKSFDFIEKDRLSADKFTENHPKHGYSIIYKMLLCPNPAPKSDSH